MALRPGAAAGGGTRAERLALSGLYLNSSDALKYLTDQLSWVGLRKGSGAGGNKEDGGGDDVSADMNPETVESPSDEKNKIPGMLPQVAVAGKISFRRNYLFLLKCLLLLSQSKQTRRSWRPPPRYCARRATPSAAA